MFDASIQSYSQMVEVLQKLAVTTLRHWHITAQDIQLIKYRENAVFRIITPQNQQFALRVHRKHYHSDAELRSELEWIAALQEYGIDVPTIIPTLDQRLFVNEWIEGLTHPLQIDLFEWIEGEQLGTSEKGLGDDPRDVQTTYQTIGKIAARLHNQATSWTIPDHFQRHKWDIEGLVGEQPLWGRYWELHLLSPTQKQLIIQARDLVKQEILALSNQVDMDQHYSLIHADFVPENLLVEHDKVRLLDFDDAGFGWHLFELATALYFIQNDSNFELAQKSLIDGYKTFRELPDYMLAKLPVFMMARGFTYLGWLHTRTDSKEGKELAPILIQLACQYAETFVAKYSLSAEVI